jgi:hypothetical protein
MKESGSLSHSVGFGAFTATALIWLAPTALAFADQRSDVEALEAQCEP